jgi:hypothetical protein
MPHFGHESPPCFPNSGCIGQVNMVVFDEVDAAF